MASIHSKTTLTKGDVYEVKYRDQFGEQKSKTFSGIDADKVALGFKKKVEYELTEGLYKGAKKKVPFREYALKWFEQYKLNIEKQSTIDWAGGILHHHLIPYFKDKDCTKIDTEYILDYRLRLAKTNISKKRVNDIIGKLDQIFNYLWRLRKIDENPCKYIDKLQYRPKARNTVSPFELQKLLVAAEDKRLEAGQIKTMICFGVYAGLRSGEVRGLKWEDINLEKRLIYVRRNFYKKIESDPKNHTARIEPVNDQLFAAILDYQLSAPQCKEGWIFPTRHGTVRYDTDVSQWFERVAEFSGIEKYLTFHCLRHTFINTGKKCNISSLIIQNLAGHKDIKSTMAYMHEPDEAELAIMLSASNKIATALQGEQNE